jgi:hypothetical protein
MCHRSAGHEPCLIMMISAVLIFMLGSSSVAAQAPAEPAAATRTPAAQSASASSANRLGADNVPDATRIVHTNVSARFTQASTFVRMRISRCAWRSASRTHAHRHERVSGKAPAVRGTPAPATRADCPASPQPRSRCARACASVRALGPSHHGCSLISTGRNAQLPDDRVGHANHAGQQRHQ